jgi:predicted RNA binding protein YcfA (HicA-like mRNA interferase family)
MKLPRDLSGEEVAAKLCRRWDYAKVSQAGSHILLETQTPSHQRVVIPAHKAVKVGTLGNIIRSVAAHKGVSKETVLHSLK